MSWQDELRRLDAELASGTITQHQHRKMRDELLAAASGGGAPAPVSSPLARVSGPPQWQSANPAQGVQPGYPPAPPEFQPQGPAPQYPPHAGAGQPYGQAPQYQPQGAVQHYAQGQAQPHQATAPQQYPQGAAAQAPQQQPQVGAAQAHVASAQGQAQQTTAPQQQPQVDAGQAAGQARQVTAPQQPPADAAQNHSQAQQPPQTAAAQQQAAAPQEQQTAPQQQAAPQQEQQEQLNPFDTEGPTQSVSAALLATSKPTSAPSPADERSTDSMRFPSIEDAPTVVTNPVPPPSRPLPGMAPPSYNAPQHQPMSFDPAPSVQTPPRRKPTWLFVTLGVVVVVALVAAGVWFLRDRQDNTTSAAGAPTTSAASSPEAVEARLPTLPGTPSTNNGTMSVDQGMDLKLYSREEGQLMKDNGATQVIFRGSSQGPQGYLVLVVPAGSPEGAPAITQGLYEHSLTAGLQTVPSGSTDTKAVTGSNAAGQMSGTWYTSGPYAVSIWVSQGLDGDPTALSERLAQTKTSLATALPPN